MNKTPAVRFIGFAEDWEQRKLTDFVDFYAGLTYTPSDVQETGTLVLRSSNVSNGEIVDADNVYVCPEVVNVENVQVGDTLLSFVMVLALLSENTHKLSVLCPILLLELL